MRSRLALPVVLLGMLSSCAHGAATPGGQAEPSAAPSEAGPEQSPAAGAQSGAQAGEQEPQTAELRYRAGGVEMRGYVAYPPGEGTHPGVLVVHEFWGLNEHARASARKLAKMGYVALAVDMYGEGQLAQHPDDARKFSKQVMSKIDDGVARFEAARAALAEDPRVDGDKIAAIGYCFGGAVVLHMARVGSDLELAASFHGGLQPIKPMPDSGFDGYIFVAHGGADSFIPEEQVEAFRHEMDSASIEYEVVVYPGATHSFTNPAATETGKKFGLPVEYNADADAASWQRLTELLEREL